MDPNYIRNFSIIAHIDHGKSTLADRLLQFTKSVNEREFKNQILDSMDLERERGITIKSQAAMITYNLDGQDYFLNFIDTPGHVDFTYEVSRSLRACEGVILVIDASQGVQAQTLANMYLALEHNLEIIPVLNKIDLPAADIDRVKKEIDKDLGLDPEHAIPISAKEGIGIEDVLKAVVKYIPVPKGLASNITQAIIFDAKYDTYRGVIVSVRVVEGKIAVGDEIMMYHSNKTFLVEELGIYRVKFIPKKELEAGEVGYIIANIRSIEDTKIGDTVTLKSKPCKTPLQGYKEIKPMVFAGLYPTDGDEYKELGDALGKLKLNDASLIYEQESSAALGFGYRCGFLGLLHMEIVQERLEREFNINLISTAPSVKYEVYLKNKSPMVIDNPAHYPDPSMIEYTKEPYAKVTIITPIDFLGNIMPIVQEKRGIQKNMTYLDEKRVQIDYEIPLAEIIFDFHDKLKSASKGYASYDYEVIDYRESQLVKVDMLVNARKVDALSVILHKDKAALRGRQIAEKLKDLIPQHLFQIPIQAAIGGNIIARETIKAMRKNVTAKCYGGDITRKRKLLEKQKEGKKRMRQIGDVEIPQEAFISVLKLDDK